MVASYDRVFWNAVFEGIVNVVSFRHNPHVRSIFSKGVLGFTERNRKRWDLLENGVRVLFYGDKGVRLAGYIKNKYESREPVTEWIKNPTGYPLHITLDLVARNLCEKVNCERFFKELNCFCF
jgi:hypothetical protein